MLEDWNTSCEFRLRHNGCAEHDRFEMDIKLLILSALIGVIAVFSRTSTVVVESERRSASAQ
jgi:hypothetical protein